MRIGELLIQQQRLQPGDVHRAVGEQSHTGKRLCSLLVSRGLLSFDDAARALSAQKRVPCALEKHLDARSLDVVSALPAELCRLSCVLPIGNTRAGDLIVCVRDPSPQLLDSLKQAARRDVMMVVAPASKLEGLVAATYGASGNDDFEVELGSVPQLPPLPDMDMLDPDSMRAALTDLDDARVEKDPSQSGQLVVQVARTTTPPAISRVATPAPARVTLPPAAPTLEQTRLALARAESRDAATDLVIAFVAGRWIAGAVLALRGSVAIGYRGHGVAAIDHVSVSLVEPSTVQRAIETKRTSNVAAAGSTQQQLARALGHPHDIAAAPVLVDGHVVAVIVVGTPLQGPSVQDDATAELGHLAHALGLAYARIHHS